MQEAIELVIQYLRDIWRFRWYALATVCLIVPIGWAAYSKVPFNYMARATVYVDTYTVLQPLLKGIAVEIDPNAYVALMSRELISRPNVEQVANIVGLDPENYTPQQWEAILAGIEQSAQLTNNRTRNREHSDFYVITYEGKDPEFTQQIVQALIDTFVERVVGESRRDSQAAKRFLGKQIEEQEARLKVAEKEMSEFKQENIDALPEEGVSYFQRLHASQAAVDSIDLEIAGAEFRRNELQRQLNENPATQRAVSLDGKPILSPLEARVLALQTRLDELVLKYTDEHPDVVATRRSLAELEKQLTTDNSTNVVPNPVHQQLKVTLGQVEGEIAALWAKRDEHVRRVRALRERTESLTQVETELQALSRAYEAEKNKFDALVSRENSVRMSGNVGETGEDVRFRVIDPPRLIGARSVQMKKRLLLVAGVPMAAVAVGLGLALLLSLMRPVVYSQRSLNELTDLPVFGSISQAVTKQWKVRQRLDIAAFTLITGIVLATHLVVVFIQIKQIDVKNLLALITGVQSG